MLVREKKVWQMQANAKIFHFKNDPKQFMTNIFLKLNKE